MIALNDQITALTENFLHSFLFSSWSSSCPSNMPQLSRSFQRSPFLQDDGWKNLRLRREWDEPTDMRQNILEESNQRRIVFAQQCNHQDLLVTWSEFGIQLTSFKIRDTPPQTMLYQASSLRDLSYNSSCVLYSVLVLIPSDLFVPVMVNNLYSTHYIEYSFPPHSKSTQPELQWTVSNKFIPCSPGHNVTNKVPTTISAKYSV